MEEGEGPGCLAPSRHCGNALRGVRHQEEEEYKTAKITNILALTLCTSLDIYIWPLLTTD